MNRITLLKLFGVSVARFLDYGPAAADGCTGLAAENLFCRALRFEQPLKLEFLRRTKGN